MQDKILGRGFNPNPEGRMSGLLAEVRPSDVALRQAQFLLFDTKTGVSY